MPLANARTLDPGRPQQSSSPRSPCNEPGPVPSHWRKAGPMSLADDIANSSLSIDMATLSSRQDSPMAVRVDIVSSKGEWSSVSQRY
jgi:hypothetical protein